MQRVWVVVLSVWAMLAIVAVLAWSYRPPAPPATAAAQTVVVKGANGKQRLVTLSAPTHATTATSAVARP
jgi:cyanate permease